MDGDFILFFEGKDLQSQLIQRIDSHWNMKKFTVSSTGKDMLVQFLTDGDTTNRGFSASFHYIPIDSKCANWLNMNSQTLKSPEYPTINCSWIITAPTISSMIQISFDLFEV